MATIRRNLVLKELDIKEDPNGNQRVFSIKFVKKDGELVAFNKAVSTGLSVNLAKNRLRGVMQVDGNGNGIGHPYPVRIDNIIEFNGTEVTL